MRPHCRIPLWVRPVARAASRQLRDREIRRDKMVRAIWLLRGCCATTARRPVAAGSSTIPTTCSSCWSTNSMRRRPTSRGRRTQARRAEAAAAFVPPEAFSGDWHPATPLAAVLTGGEGLYGIGVSGGRVRGRVRIVDPTPSTICSPARSSSPRSPTSATRPPSPTPRRSSPNSAGRCRTRRSSPGSSAFRVSSMPEAPRRVCRPAPWSRWTEATGGPRCRPPTQTPPSRHLSADVPEGRPDGCLSWRSWTSRCRPRGRTLHDRLTTS